MCNVKKGGKVQNNPRSFKRCIVLNTPYKTYEGNRNTSRHISTPKIHENVLAKNDQKPNENKVEYNV